MQAAKGKGNDPNGRKAKSQFFSPSLPAHILGHPKLTPGVCPSLLCSEFAAKDLRSVGNYTLGRLIGRGSFGKVYLANHKLINGTKVVLKSADKNDSNLAREIHHHRQFVHPHIARLYEVIVTENLVWMVLEYCAGDELYNYLLKHGPLPVEKVRKIFTQLVGAVSYVHIQSCVHRDLKLENILLDKNENVKLVDFGFTREYEGKSNHLQTFCGTICYSAPEMLKGEKYAGEKVDVWSLGVILYALLCGELPFDDDDDNETRRKILGDDPKFPDHMPADAVALIKALLSKRPFVRPTLPDILASPFLAEHAPTQQAILKIQRPAPFSTQIEKDTLERMRLAGVNVDNVIDSVIGQRCDVLSGWWALLLEKEERKMQRRERKRKEKEAEAKSIRRLSAASARFDRSGLHMVNSEAGSPVVRRRASDHLLSTPRARGRSERRSAHYSDYQIPDVPPLSSDRGLQPHTPRPFDRESVRSSSTSQTRRPIPPPKEGDIRSARSRGSTLHLVAPPNVILPQSVPEADNEHGGEQKVRKKHSQAFIAQWKNWTHWIFETTRRTRPSRRTSHSTPDLREKGKSPAKDAKEATSRPQTSKYPGGKSQDGRSTSTLPPGFTTSAHHSHSSKTIPPMPSNPSLYQQAAPVSPLTPTPNHRMMAQQYKRQSLSPSPLTPRTAMRRSSTGLRGRKSTSSSISSIRSIHHHHHSHSKASSTSSNGSISASFSKANLARGTSPHHSVKVLPATPVSQSIPSNIRLVRGSSGPPPLAMFNEGMPMRDMQAPGSPNPFGSGVGGGGVMFAKRKRNVFKGPMLSIATTSAPGARGPAGSAGNPHGHGRSHSRSASASGLGRRSGEITIAEEDEDFNEEGEEEIEDVEEFSPVVSRPGEIVEEHIFEDIEAEESLAAGEPEPGLASGLAISSSGVPTLPPLDLPRLSDS